MGAIMDFLEALRMARDNGGYLTQSPSGGRLVDDAIEDALNDGDGDQYWNWTLTKGEYKGEGQISVACQVLSATSDGDTSSFPPDDVYVLSYAACKNLEMLSEDE